MMRRILNSPNLERACWLIVYTAGMLLLYSVILAWLTGALERAVRL